MDSKKHTEKERGERRRYDDACAAAHAMELLGERWALLVVRELMLGPRRFRDLRAGMPRISAAVLSQRLSELEAAGVVTHGVLPPPASAPVYALTPWGYEAEPIFGALGRWAARSPSHNGAYFSAASFVLSMRTMFAPERARGFSARLGFEIDEERYLARVAGATFAVDRLQAHQDFTAEAIVSGPAPTLAGAIYGPTSFAELADQGAVTLVGDGALLARFETLFPLPPKATEPP